jgi:hypothetical protein
MLSILKDPQSTSDVRYDAIRVLYYIGPDAKAAMGVLVKVLDDQDASVRNAALYAIMSVGRPLDESLGPRMMELLDDEETAVTASIALGRIGKVPVPPVRALLKSESRTKRVSALRVLAGIGPPGREVLPDVIRMVSDETTPIERSAHDVMWEECGCGARISLEGNYIYAQAHAAVVAMGMPGGVAGVDDLLWLLADPELESRPSPIEYWPTADRKDIRMLRNLAHALKDRRARVRFAAANVLSVLGLAARDVAPALKAAIRDDINGDVRGALREALKSICGRASD